VKDARHQRGAVSTFALCVTVVVSAALPIAYVVS
jgi:hypothetical protein